MRDHFRAFVTIIRKQTLVFLLGETILEPASHHLYNQGSGGPILKWTNLQRRMRPTYRRKADLWGKLPVYSIYLLNSSPLKTVFFLHDIIITDMLHTCDICLWSYLHLLITWPRKSHLIAFQSLFDRNLGIQREQWVSKTIGMQN